jgi:hypothetical protein
MSDEGIFPQEENSNEMTESEGKTKKQHLMKNAHKSRHILDELLKIDDKNTAPPFGYG